jgi:hypothetical protein
MKNSWFSILLLPLAACHNDKSKMTASKADTNVNKVEVKIKNILFKPYLLKADYYVTDTGYFNIGIGDGVYAVIKKDEKLIDTIALAYGINHIQGDQFLYYTINGEGPAKNEDANPKYKKSIMASLGNYTIISNAKKELLTNMTPDFDDYFSSPSAINGNIYYWQIKKIDSSGQIKVSAAEFDPITKQTKSLFLMNDYLETDDSGYFPQPYSNKDTIYFNAGKDKIIKFSKDFKSYN